MGPSQLASRVVVGCNHGSALGVRAACADCIAAGYAKDRQTTIAACRRLFKTGMRNLDRFILTAAELDDDPA